MHVSSSLNGHELVKNVLGAFKPSRRTLVWDESRCSFDLFCSLRLASSDVDLSSSGFCTFRDFNPQHAIFEIGIDVVTIRRSRQLKRSAERSILPFESPEVLTLLLFF